MGLPGREKSIVSFVRPAVERVADELAAVIGLEAFENATLGGKPAQDADNLLAFDVLIGVDR